MRRPLPTKEFTRALCSLRQDVSAPIAVFKDLLDLGTAPENMPQIATDSKIVPVCMGLLQQYCAHSRIFGENNHGVICICLIALRVEVNLLESIGCSFDDSDDVDYDGPTSNLRMLEDDLSNGIVGVYQDRRPEDPPDLFRTSVGLVHAPPVLTADQAGRILDYLHRERDLFLRARVSGTSNWIGWPFLFHALWERLVFRNDNKITKAALKLLDIFCRFMIVEPEDTSQADLLEHLVARIKLGMSTRDVASFPVNPSDRQEIMKAYIHRLTNAPNAPTMRLSHAFFKWVVLALDRTQADLVVEFMTTTCDRLWGVLEDMKTRGPIEFVQISLGMTFVAEVIECLGNYLAGDLFMPRLRLGFAKEITRLLKQAFLERDIISLIARALMLPTLSSAELETLSDTDKKVANFWFDEFFNSMLKLSGILSQHFGAFTDFFMPLLHDWVKGSHQIMEQLLKYDTATFTYNYLDKCRDEWDSLAVALFMHMGIAKAPMSDCSYPRCPLPTLDKGAMCQNLDWWGSATVESHMKTCGPSK
ncbi:hypothetical protein FRC12_010300 [Ceratobasidium sp. 428]|nr:hypothetical protein FRC12_010300 [Ceratobasidium sp. 428]